MRAFVLIAIAVVATSCKHDAPCSEPVGISPVPRAAADAPSIRAVYEEPKNPAHRHLYAEVRERHVLENVAEAISAVRLPKQLLLEFKGCDGDSNAYYDEEKTSIIFCYEYLADIEDTAAKNVVDSKFVGIKGSDEQVPLDEAVDGPVVFVLFHEAGHAVYHLLKVPVLGRQEDAADYFAAAALLRLGNDVAMRYLRGAAWAYAVGAKSANPDVSDFSDSHSLDSQRYFNILCLAYGSDPDYFAVAVKRWHLPEARAGECRWEYRQVKYALQKLVMPSVDQGQLDYVRMKHQGKAGSSTSPGQ